jgi:hypothetical protein
VTDDTTPADGAASPLKRSGGVLDSCHEMRLDELKLRIQRSDYVIDPAAVAEAMLRHALVARRAFGRPGACWTSPQTLSRGVDLPDGHGEA